MNFSKGKSSFSIVSVFATALGVAALTIAALPSLTNSIARASGAGLDVEVPFEIKALKAPGLVAPYFLQDNHGAMVVSDQAGGVYSVTFGGKVTALADKTKIKNPSGVAIGPAGFGSYGGNVFVLAATGGIKGQCEVERIDQSGAVSTFAKLPAAAATECRDLEFGAASSPFAGKLYAAVSGNSTIYSIDSSGKASTFGNYSKPVAFELTTITFPPASDSKAAGMMLVGMRAKGGFASKVGRIAIVGADGKMKDEVYLVGFTRPSGFAWSPSGFGSYGDELLIADTGKFAAENDNERDGNIYRVERDVSRPFASGLMDPTDMKFIGNKAVICDPAEKGKGQGAIVIISSLL
ncbi:MAG TPA: hypothetical protein VJX68_12455 [Candidatus Binatus sp.]|uniref:hypothetical protein n=1 Tax=Candidatus Binatus sp. TaxID=2811406 RepID=UPI002B45D228|nr:hypothetical protein [Candidatus Binatus sp.]HKN13994.1 hypothetical protein [Candidatus Binatus sp.]